MQNGNFLEKLSSQFGQNATVKNVFGEPIQTGGKTIIPVAQIAYGLGGGYGQGKKNKPAASGATSPMNDEGANGEGAGGGGGIMARPKGVYEVTANSTRFIPVRNNKLLLLGLGIGFLLRGWLMKQRNH
jgi:uncharacterized spore protein YtfJ